MNDSILLLTNILESARSGIVALEGLIRHAKGLATIADFTRWRERYCDVERAAERRLRQLGEMPTRRDEHRALWAEALIYDVSEEPSIRPMEMLVKEGEQSIEALSRARHALKEADLTARDLASRLLTLRRACLASAYTAQN